MHAARQQSRVAGVAGRAGGGGVGGRQPQVVDPLVQIRQTVPPELRQAAVLAVVE